MRQTNIALCPRLKVREDVPDFEGRMFANVAILQSRLETAYKFDGKELVSAKDVADILNMILEVEEVSVNDPL